MTRKNALFAGSDRGGNRLVGGNLQAERRGPQAYFADVIARIVGGYPQSRLDELLPWVYPTVSGLKAAA